MTTNHALYGLLLLLGPFLACSPVVSGSPLSANNSRGRPETSQARHKPAVDTKVRRTSPANATGSTPPLDPVKLGPIGAPVIPHDRLLTDDELLQSLDSERYPQLAAIQQLYSADPQAGLKALAEHFRAMYAERYLFNWTKVDQRFQQFRHRFPGARKRHEHRKKTHVSLYPAKATWKLPFNNLQGRSVSAYELRHLARQHKVLSMAFVHLYEDRNPAYIEYFATQMRSLNAAFTNRAFEDDDGGNGVFESYRGGTRVLQWLKIHGFFLGSAHYHWRDQIDVIRSLLLEGAILNQKNPSYRRGNHQTRGMSALGMLAILLREYKGTSLWYKTAESRLEEHLTREIYPDGFQFERTIHYHVADIKNYFGLYQLAKLNRYPVSKLWATRLRAMFDALRSLARPDGNLPVSSDDTSNPWSENNDLGGIMLLGAILFDDPQINAFASKKLPRSLYWSLRSETVESLGKLTQSAPTHGSSALPQTGFYVMRDGWKKSSLYMNISAGYTPAKPDHQHGDMLGLTAYGRRRELLPNYTVRYSLGDLAYFKNSLSKNVALVDSVLQGQEWTPNKGGSGFGKWRKLPTPRVITWQTSEHWDYFAGSHDAYESRGVKYYRKVFFLKGLGWLVKDVFSSNQPHDYQQVWQGHYSQEAQPHHFRSADARGAGLEILQLGDKPTKAETSARRGKGNILFTLRAKAAQFTTFLYPFAGFGEKLPHDFSSAQELTLEGWKIQQRRSKHLKVGSAESNARIAASHGKEHLLFGGDHLVFPTGQLTFARKTDALVVEKDKGYQITVWDHEATSLRWSGLTIKGEQGRVLTNGTPAAPGATFQVTN